MRPLEHYLEKAHTVTIKVLGRDVELITQEEMRDFIQRVYGREFVNRSQAMKLTKLTYLMGIDTSAKIKKGKKLEYATGILYLQPYKTAFGNSCAKGDPCFSSCLMTAGRVKMDIHEFKILRARYFKTILFYVNRDYFNGWLHAEIAAAVNKHKDRLMIRLNGTSDLHPNLFGNPMEAFPDTIFYDYTKVYNRIDVAEKYANYHITYSYSGYNYDECKSAQERGIHVAFVVDGEMPDYFDGVKVFSMDETDLRPLDPLETPYGNYGYLKLKETMNKDYDYNFVVSGDDDRLIYVTDIKEEVFLKKTADSEVA